MLWLKHIKQNTYMAPCVQIQIHLGLGLYTSNVYTNIYSAMSHMYRSLGLFYLVEKKPW